MNSEDLRERQRILQAERQQRYRERKGKINKKIQHLQKEQKQLLMKFMKIH